MPPRSKDSGGGGGGGGNKTVSPAPGNKGKKNPPKNPGAASVNPVEEDKESADSDGNDTDALSHLLLMKNQEQKLMGQVRQMEILKTNDNHHRRNNLQKIKF